MYLIIYKSNSIIAVIIRVTSNQIMSRRNKFEQKLLAEEPLASAEERAQRIRRIRNLANLTRLQMCEGVQININTLKGWEIGRYGGLTTLGAEKIVARVAREGVQCSCEWLMYGMGVGPRMGHPLILHDNYQKDEKYELAQELAFLHSHYEGVMDFIIEDNMMCPFYAEGDCVAGIELTQNDYCSAIGMNCIVETLDGDRYARQLLKGSNGYSIKCLSSDFSILEPIIYNVPIIRLAPIIWHRKRITVRNIKNERGV